MRLQNSLSTMARWNKESVGKSIFEVLRNHSQFRGWFFYIEVYFCAKKAVLGSTSTGFPSNEGKKSGPIPSTASFDFSI